MNRKGTLWERFTAFVSGNGFYLVLLICVAAIGLSGYFLVRSISGAQGEEQLAAVGSAQLPEEGEAAASAPVTPGEQTTQKPAVSRAPVSSPSPAPVEESPEVTLAETPAAQVSAPVEPEADAGRDALVFTRPVNGGIIASFSVETLLYDETMGDWRIHEGVDLAAALGSRVLATAAGTVKSVYEDELMGATVVIDHGDGLTSVYANLHPQPPVEEGERVYTGDVIGAVGDTAIAESGREPHIHFAMYQDGQAVDPEVYLPEL